MMVFVTIGLSLFGRPRYDCSPATPALDFVLTVLYFLSISIELQVILAIVLSSSKPSPSRAPSRLSEWVVASAVWVFLAAYFFSYAMGLHAPEPNTVDLILAGIASTVNLAITVYSMLRVSCCDVFCLSLKVAHRFA
jgi:hypothetical protein